MDQDTRAQVMDAESTIEIKNIFFVYLLLFQFLFYSPGI